jgi:hypothetical protein
MKPLLLDLVWRAEQVADWVTSQVGMSAARWIATSFVWRLFDGEDREVAQALSMALGVPLESNVRATAFRGAKEPMIFWFQVDAVTVLISVDGNRATVLAIFRAQTQELAKLWEEAQERYDPDLVADACRALLERCLPAAPGVH